MDNLESLSRKELQSLAKTHGVKANLSNSAIVEALKAVLTTAPSEIQEEQQINEQESVVVSNIAPRKSILLQPEVTAEELQASVQQFENVIHEESTKGPFFTNCVKDTKEQDTVVIGSNVEFFLGVKKVVGIVKRINKMTCRITLATGDEVTVKTVELSVIIPKEEITERQIEESEKLEVSAETESHIHVEEVSQTVSVEVETEMEQENFISNDEAVTEKNEMEVIGNVEVSGIVEEEAEFNTEGVNETVLYGEFIDESIITPYKTTLEEGNETNDEEEQGGSEESFMEEGEEEKETAEEDEEMLDDDQLLSIDNLIQSLTPTPRRPRTSGIMRPSFSSVKKTIKFAERKSLSAKKASESTADPTENTLKKTFSNTPLKSKPAIIPKTNAAQLKRMEALQQKKLQESGQVSS
jgi:hypothetical protein